MIKVPIPKRELDVVVGSRFVSDGDENEYEAHIYLKHGAEVHGGIGKTPEEALFNAVAHWRKHEDAKPETV